MYLNNIELNVKHLLTIFCITILIFDISIFDYHLVLLFSCRRGVCIQPRTLCTASKYVYLSRFEILLTSVNEWYKEVVLVQ